MDYVLLKIDSNELKDAFEWLGKHPLNDGLNEPKIALNNNEVWEYIGSWKNNDKLISQFRHKSHTKTNGPVTTTFEHISFNNDSFEKKIKV